MADIVDPDIRSRMMSGIRSKDTKPEIAVRKFLHRCGLRFRLGGCGLPGRPDIVLPKWKTVVRVHGCFWHRHPGCRFAYNPATRVDFWQQKFSENVKRDYRTAQELEDLGWKVLTIWECEIDEAELTRLVNEICDNGSRKTG